MSALGAWQDAPDVSVGGDTGVTATLGAGSGRLVKPENMNRRRSEERPEGSCFEEPRAQLRGKSSARTFRRDAEDPAPGESAQRRLKLLTESTEPSSRAARGHETFPLAQSAWTRMKTAVPLKLLLTYGNFQALLISTHLSCIPSTRRYRAQMGSYHLPRLLLPR